ncbi:MAG TPA: three-Cys-motif partner protein TcmP [Parafilimonas sp.]|nr:three-Cys-motif partner protein TcmP [Parafilimonas sp.]
MPAKNLFDKPFDEGTRIKLGIYKEYFREWLPVFVAKKNPIWKAVQIFDFFAGRGKDKNAEFGSPLIAIDVIQSLNNHIVQNNIKVTLHLNELDGDSYNALIENVSGLNTDFEIKTYNKHFQAVFDEHYNSMKNSANFLFLDQNGIKEITNDIFQKITSLKQTDFLFFISSSYFKRFATTTEFQKYFPFDPKEVESIDYYHIHRKVLNHYKSLIPSNKKYFLAPFSIKKGANIYGLIFGTNHTLGIEKFLSVAWKKDTLRGEANYDIDNEKINIKTPSLFEQYDKPNKRQVFEKNLADYILNNYFKTNYDVYLFGLNEGFLLKDVNTVLKNLKTDKKIDFDFTLISSDLHKLENIQSIKLL